MPSAFSVPVPSDYRLGRDYCSYGYFLLTPNHWHVDTQSLTTTLDPAAVRVASGAAVTVRVSQGKGRVHKAGEELTVRPDRVLGRDEKQAVRGMLARMLRLDEDAAVIAAFHKADSRWKKANGVGVAAKGRGRLMRSPTFFEDVIKTVTSCNVTWPSTIIMNRRLCEALGRESPSGLHAFPTAAAIAKTRPAALRGRCNVGYRDARIVELARMFERGIGERQGAFSKLESGEHLQMSWFEDAATADDELYEALLEWPGIGPYAAANIMQLLGRYSRLPLDTESVRHGKVLLKFRGSDRQIMKRIHKHFEPFGPNRFRSYWLEMWEYYEAKRGPAWTWERETTGKTFTAAMLRE